MTTGAVMEELGISRMTLYKWIDRNLIAVIKAVRGGRTFFVFDEAEVRRVKSRLKPKRQKGKPLLRSKPRSRT